MPSKCRIRRNLVEKGRRRPAIVQDEDLTLGARKCDIEETALFGAYVLLGISQDQIDDGIIGNLAWKSVPSCIEANNNNVICFKPLRCVNSME